MITGLAAGLFILFSGLKLTSFALKGHLEGLAYSFIRRNTAHKGMAVLAGFFSTIILQSSSLVTIFVIGFINGRFISLKQGLSIVLGANLGTTVTSQVFALDARCFVQPLFALAACLLILEELRGRKTGGLVLLGLAVVLGGVEILGEVLRPLSNSVFVQDLLLQGLDVPWRGIVSGAAVAAVLQSSSVTIGMVIILGKLQLLQLGDAIALVLGADFGTCITALVASIGTIRAAWYVALGHLLFNLLSIFLVIPFWGLFIQLISLTASELPRQIAHAHFFYNLAGVLFLFPFLDRGADLLEDRSKRCENNLKSLEGKKKKIKNNSKDDREKI